MEDSESFSQQLQPLTTLKDSVETFAARCVPDYIPATYADISFRAVQPLEILGYDDDDVPAYVGLVTKGDTGATHLFTDWARGQLLSALGVRRKWFSAVSREQEAAELTLRAENLTSFRIRAMRTEVDGIRMLRGLVSHSYADIPDTTILQQLCAALPGGSMVTAPSGKTDRALYAYVLADMDISMPGGPVVRPGLVVVNSEVGYTSLWVRPILWVPSMKAVAVMTMTPLLRRIHRGSDVDLQSAFTTVLEDARKYWGSLPEMLEKLAKVVFQTDAEAAEALYQVVLRAKGAKQFANDCRVNYVAHQYTTHTGVELFETLLRVANKTSDRDSRFDAASVAGATLHYLTR